MILRNCIKNSTVVRKAVSHLNLQLGFLKINFVFFYLFFPARSFSSLLHYRLIHALWMELSINIYQTSSEFYYSVVSPVCILVYWDHCQAPSVLESKHCFHRKWKSAQSSCWYSILRKSISANKHFSFPVLINEYLNKLNKYLTMPNCTWVFVNPNSKCEELAVNFTFEYEKNQCKVVIFFVPHSPLGHQKDLQILLNLLQLRVYYKIMAF